MPKSWAKLRRFSDVSSSTPKDPRVHLIWRFHSQKTALPAPSTRSSALSLQSEHGIGALTHPVPSISLSRDTLPTLLLR